MKHSKEWITCDRCGKVIDERPSFIPFVSSRIVKASEISQYISESSSYIRSIERLPNSDYCELEIVNGHCTNIVKYHLCERCRKLFDKFMKNE